jgi:hypothetical protein
VAEDIDSLVKRVKENPVRIALHVDGLDHRKGLGIEHGDRFAGRKPVR